MSDIIKQKLNIELEREGRLQRAGLRKVRYAVELPMSPGWGLNVHDYYTDDKTWKEAYFHTFMTANEPLAILENEEGYVFWTFAICVQFIS